MATACAGSAARLQTMLRVAELTMRPSNDGPARRYHSGGSTASAYSFLKRAMSSAAGKTLATLPTPWPLPQISFQAFGFALSPDASVPKLILDASDVGRFSGSMRAATIEG